MNLRFWLLWFGMLVLPLWAHSGNSYFEFSEDLQLAYNNILSLKLTSGQVLLDEVKRKEPNNALVYLIEDYIDFFTLFIGEEEKDFKQLEKNKKTRLAIIRDGDKSSPYYLYSQAEINLHWALVRTKFEQKFKAFGEISTAYELLTKNVELFPSFIANQKSLGVLHAALGTIPNKYKWGVKLIGGMEGSVKQGCEELEEVIVYGYNNPYHFAEESLVLYAFMQLHLNNNAQKAYTLISQADLDTQNNPLACFVKANIAMRSGHTDEAIEVLLSRPKDDAYFPFHYLDFTLGVAKLHRLDEDADLYLQAFLDDFDGRNYIKEAHQKLAWHSVIRGDMAGYEKNIKECIYKGFSIIDEDKTAKSDALAGLIPNKDLLKVRMLSDGGYYKRALDLLDEIDIGFSEDQYIEYIYRKARLTQQTGQIDTCLSLYTQIIENWTYNPSYMICNSALQMGIIHEAQESYDIAKKYFELALSKNPEEYKIGLHQKAKAGLSRLKSQEKG